MSHLDISFTQWRESRNNEDDPNSDNELKHSSKPYLHPKILASESGSESDSENVESYSNNILVPDSDESDNGIHVVSRFHNNVSTSSVVEESDDESIFKETTKNFEGPENHSSDYLQLNNSKSNLRLKNKLSLESNNSVTREHSRIVDSDHNIHFNEINKTKNNSSLITDTDEEIIIRQKKVYKIIDSDSEEESFQKSSSNNSITKKSSQISEHQESRSNKGKAIKKENLSLITGNVYNIDDSDSETGDVFNSPKTGCKDRSENKHQNKSPAPENFEKETITTVDLTLTSKNVFKGPRYIDLTEEKDKPNNEKRTIIDSYSEENHYIKPKELSLGLDENKLSVALSNVSLSSSSSSTSSKPSSAFPVGFQSQSLENDYTTRIESLIAEETRLKAQVSEIMKSIENTKSTLRSANLEALPDRGFRLQVNLKKQESQLRDLRYQQNTLSNEILKLQFMSNNSSAIPKPRENQGVKPKIFKLPTTNTDINAMGKRAMETHRTQQALTVDALRSLHKSLINQPKEDQLSDDPEELKVSLMAHQKHALSWLMWRENEKPSGGILADDMGLGKTLTMIALILKSNTEEKEIESESEDEEERDDSWKANQRPKLIPGKTLVVCPASLVSQWEGEVQKRVKNGKIDIMVHHGSRREKKARRLARHDIVITTYTIVSRDVEQSESPLFQIRWRRIILDEAHQIRNYKTKSAIGVFRLKARSRWALTGTPVHNKELDLFALIKFLRCAPFDDLAVWKRWVDNRDAAGAQRLNTILKSIMLRRTKSGLQQVGVLKSLTEKKFHKIFVTMDSEESAIYEKLLNYSKTLFARFLHQKAEKENCLGPVTNPTKSSNYLYNNEDAFKNHPELARLHKQMKEMQDVKSHHILVLLLRLRQFCCHPALIKTMLEKEDMAGTDIEDDGLDVALMENFNRMSLVKEKENEENIEPDSTTLDSNNPLFSEDRLSSKMRTFMEKMEELLKSDDKILVVSQWVSLLDLVHRKLKEKKIKCVSLTGQVPVKERGEIVEKFNTKGHGPRVMLLSLTAGGVGLNLVGGNHLLLLDLHWNPQLESQACDRIYRVGQEKNVQIYKFITSETVEEQILQLQEKKLAVADGILTGANHSSKLTLEDLKMLFKVS